ncbi:MAG: mannosyltransferase family protein [Vicinamibacterales bacterium]
MSSPPRQAAESPSPLPTWARVVDMLCFALLLLAVVVAVWGGFRMRFGGVRIALTSPYRIVAAAFLLGLVRHALVRHPAIWADLPGRVLGSLRTSPARTALSAVVATRPAIFFAGYMAVILFGYGNNGQAPFRLSDNEVANLQVRWDMAWYFGIASEGYAFSPNYHGQQNIVFFPAFPMIWRMAARLMGGQTMAFVTAGTVVVLVCFFLALTYLFRLARDITGDDDPAGYAVWLLAAYPFALFFGAIYTESLYLLGAIAAFYHFRRRELRAAGAWGLLVGLTRPNGCFLSIPLAVVAISPWLPTWLNGGPAGNVEQEPSRRTFAALVPAMLSAAMPGIGVLLYSAWMWYFTGNPLQWADGHAAWGREYSGFLPLIADRYDWIVNAGLYTYSTHVPTDVLNTMGAAFGLACTIPVARRLGLAYAVFILVNILPPMAAGGMLSLGRFSSVLFPAFIWCATAIPARHRSGWVASFMALQALNATLFYTWRELF